LYRFLDKRFYRKSSITYPLEAFACEKIGLTRPIKMNASGHPTSDIAQLKRLLLNPIRELEVIGYIKPMAPSQRFAKGVQGVWEVYFERQQSLSPEQAEQLEQVDLPLISEDVSPLEGRLISHGVTRLQAKKLVSDYHQAQIEIQLEVLEFLLAKGGEAAPANRGGWLVKAVTENYSQPRGFKSTAQRLEESRLKAEKSKQRLEAAAHKNAAEQEDQERDNAAWQKDKTRIRAYLEALSPQKRTEVEVAAITANPIGMLRTSPRIRQTIVDRYVLDILDGRVTPPIG
jgi:hypothetical protein